MFERNSNYNVRFYGRDTEIKGKDVVLYPENRLEPLVVTSDFGDCLVNTSDLYDLFNQQRIANFGADVVRDFIARNYPISSAISDKISKMTDDEIMESIKPRNVQSYSELMLWSKYLNRQIEEKLDSVKPAEDIDQDEDIVQDKPSSQEEASPSSE